MSVNPAAPPARRVSVVGLLGVLGVVIVLAVGVGTVRNAVRGDDDPVLPDTFSGRARIASDQDFGGEKQWRENASAAVGGAGVSGAAYGTVAEGRINVTAARGDLAGKLDLVLVADTGTAYGDVRCTRNLTYVNPTLRSNVLLCWHTSATRSAFALALKNPPEPGKLAADVDELWQKLG